MTEVSLVLVTVIAAIAGMQVYLKRGMQARYKSSVDLATNQGINQYEPYYLDKTSSQEIETKDTEQAKGKENYLRQDKTTTVQGSYTVKEGVDWGADDDWD